MSPESDNLDMDTAGSDDDSTPRIQFSSGTHRHNWDGFRGSVVIESAGSQIVGEAENLLPGAGQLEEAQALARTLTPTVLKDRLMEREAISSWIGSDDQYLWVRGAPWAGKTSLAADLVVNPIPGTAVVSFFVISRLLGNNDLRSFISNVSPQLANIARLRAGLGSASHSPASRYLRLLEMADEECASGNRRLVLIVDGIDEDRSAASGSIASALPMAHLANTRVLVLSRYEPELPADVPVHHPIRESRRLHLVPSKFATELRGRASTELRQLLANGDSLERRLIALAVAASDALTSTEMGSVLGISPAEVRNCLRGSFARIFRRVDDLTTGEPKYFLAHDVLARAASEELEEEASTHRNALISWCDRQLENRDPFDFALLSYPRLLTKLGHLEKARTIVTKTQWQDLARARTRSDAHAAGLIEEIAAGLTSHRATDELSLVSLGIMRARLSCRSPKPPLETLWFLVAAGELDAVRNLILLSGSGDLRAVGFAYLAQAVWDYDRPLAERFVGECRIALSTIGDSTVRIRSLALVCDALAVSDRNTAIELLAQASQSMTLLGPDLEPAFRLRICISLARAADRAHQAFQRCPWDEAVSAFQLSTEAADYECATLSDLVNALADQSTRDADAVIDLICMAPRAIPLGGILEETESDVLKYVATRLASEVLANGNKAVVSFIANIADRNFALAIGIALHVSSLTGPAEVAPGDLLRALRINRGYEYQTIAMDVFNRALDSHDEKTFPAQALGSIRRWPGGVLRNDGEPLPVEKELSHLCSARLSIAITMLAAMAWAVDGSGCPKSSNLRRALQAVSGDSILSVTVARARMARLGLVSDGVGTETDWGPLSVEMSGLDDASLVYGVSNLMNASRETVEDSVIRDAGFELLKRSVLRWAPDRSVPLVIHTGNIAGRTAPLAARGTVFRDVARSWPLPRSERAAYQFTMLAAASAPSMGYFLPWYCLLRAHYASVQAGISSQVWDRLEPVRASIRASTWSRLAGNSEAVEFTIYANELAASALGRDGCDRIEIWPTVVANVSPWLEQFSPKAHVYALRLALDICTSEIRSFSDSESEFPGV